MPAEYIPPSEVNSPRKRWSLIMILFDPKRAHDCVLALGRWDDHPVLAMRWNGNKDNPIGNPQSRGLPTWFILPDRYVDALIETLVPDMRTLARNFFPKKRQD